MSAKASVVLRDGQKLTTEVSQPVVAVATSDDRAICGAIQKVC